MVGLVLVSHSKALADALIELVKQVSAQEIPLAAAAGVGMNRQEFGTDATDIAEAIQQVYSPEGVLVLMDLGSAILSAEMALEFLPPEQQAHVRFCEASLVEGAISAGVQISLGQDLETVFREARRALEPKIEQLGDYLANIENTCEMQDDAQLAEETEKEWQELTLTILTKHGLHARPAARFVQTAAKFDAEIQVCLYDDSPCEQKRSSSVSATSLSGLMTLGVSHGDRIIVMACGPEKDQALKSLRQLAEQNFNETEGEQEESPRAASEAIDSAEETLTIVPLSQGIALGPAQYFRANLAEIPEGLTEDPDAEWEQFQQALDKVRCLLEERRRTILTSLGESQSEIFKAHFFILTDSALLDRTHDYVYEQRLNIAAAWRKSIEELAESYRALADPYLQQRANDVVDVGDQVLSVLSGQHPSHQIVLSEPGILLVEEVTPGFVIQLKPEKVLGLVSKRGGPTDHSSILLRSLGIPAIVVPWLVLPRENFSGYGASHSTLCIEAGAPLAIDAFQGMLWVDASLTIIEELRQRRDAWREGQRKQLGEAMKPATTRDGHRLLIAANASGEFDAGISAERGAEAIGVLRTEFLYVTRTIAPTEQEQNDMLVRIAERMKGGPVYVRTLDVGGDKELPYIKLAPEANPFLGVRSIRLSLRMPELFLTQLRAILRAGAQNDIRLMFPMICRTDELASALELLQQAHQVLELEKIPHRWPIPVSMMIETPAAVLQIDSFADYVEHFSIGTNDLIQYTMAAERGNPELLEYADGLHPAILRQIQVVVEAAHRRGRHVAVCGELASDPCAVPVLLGLDVDELSLNPGSIPEVKATVRKIELEAATLMAQQALQAESAGEVRKLAIELLQGSS